MFEKFKKRYVGDKAFYRAMLTIAIPLVIQQGITNFVNLLDNLMVGALGEEVLSGVSIMNQLIFIFNITLFGGLAGASIFGAQFFGKKDWAGMRHTFRFRLVFGVTLTAAALLILTIFGEQLALLFLENDFNAPERVESTLLHASRYLQIALWSTLPFMITQVYSGMLRECGETVHPMVASLIALTTNLVLNYCLIYGVLFFPEMGAAGAGLATVIARVLEAIYIVSYTHMHADKFPYIKGAYRSLKIPADLSRKIIVTGTPLMINEFFWSLGMTAINGSYASRGLEVVAASNIASTAWNLFCVMMFAMGTVASIMVGQKLGAGDKEGAQETARRLILVTEVVHTLIGLIMILVGGWIPLLYDVSETTRRTAGAMLRLQGLVLPIHSYAHVTYFVIRSGGKTFITFLFDSVYTWCIPVLTSFILCRLTVLPIILCYGIVQATDLVKMAIAIPMVKSDFWAKNIIEK